MAFLFSVPRVSLCFVAAAALGLLLSAAGPGASGLDITGDRMAKPTCIDIPSEMSLCHDIGYKQMRMPNLLGHDSLSEVQQQASSWVPLLTQNCHSDTKLFLCSLFAPVCLEMPIYPCRSLCEMVRDACLPIMLFYKFPWPEMLKCDKLPKDNDLCLASLGPQNRTKNPSSHPPLFPGQESSEESYRGSSEETGVDLPLPTCSQCRTTTLTQNETESFVDKFCDSHFVLKTRISEVKRSRNSLRVFGEEKKSRFYRQSDKLSKKDIRKMTFWLDQTSSCVCNLSTEDKTSYLIMGMKRAKKLYIDFVHPWEKDSRDFKKLSRQLRNPPC